MTSMRIKLDIGTFRCLRNERWTLCTHISNSLSWLEQQLAHDNMRVLILIGVLSYMQWSEGAKLQYITPNEVTVSTTNNPYRWHWIPERDELSLSRGTHLDAKEEWLVPVWACYKRVWRVFTMTSHVHHYSSAIGGTHCEIGSILNGGSSGRENKMVSYWLLSGLIMWTRGRKCQLQVNLNRHLHSHMEQVGKMTPM